MTIRVIAPKMAPIVGIVKPALGSWAINVGVGCGVAVAIARAVVGVGVGVTSEG